MNEKDDKLNKGSFLYIGDQNKAEWGYPEGYPWKEKAFEDIVWDGNTENKETADLASYYNYCKVSDTLITSNELVGKELSYIVEGVEHKRIITVDAITDASADSGVITVLIDSVPIIVVCTDVEKASSSFHANSIGVYFVKLVNGYPTCLKGTAFHPMSDRFLSYPIMLVTITESFDSDNQPIYSTRFSESEIRTAVASGYIVIGYCYKDGFLTLDSLANTDLNFSRVSFITETSCIVAKYIISDNHVARSQKSLTLS